jgi:hypothetical protein
MRSVQKRSGIDKEVERVKVLDNSFGGCHTMYDFL